MKISLHLGEGDSTSRAAADRVLERDILAAKKGDWEAKHNLVRTFLPLLTSLAEKRTREAAKVSRYVEAGKEGLYKAARRYKPSIGADRFRVFALDFIEKAMDACDRGGGFWSRLFGS